MSKNNLWCLSALLLTVTSSVALGMVTSPVKVSSQVASRMRATPPATLTKFDQAIKVPVEKTYSSGNSLNSSKALGEIFPKPAAVVAQVSPDWPTISLTKRFSGLSQPVHITHAGDRSGRLFVVERTGRIRIVKNGVLLSQPFLNITSRVRSSEPERGLLSVAFPPNYASKKYFYVYYTNLSGDIVVARYRVTTNPDLANPNRQEVVLTINHQQFPNHNGGQLAFGPDGYLYMGTGDGGGSGDPLNNGQNPASLLGKILRIDVESGVAPYAIPPSNRFRQTPGYRPEIWALGLRNPWRFSFDRKMGDLYISDVGQKLYEEVNFESSASKGGRNYGWRIMEGKHCYDKTTCNKSGLTLPIVEYEHSKGCSVTGGMVYRGQNYPDMQGIYFYGDFCSGRIWGLKRSGTTWQNTLLLDTAFTISSFGEDQAGNLYVVDYNGDIYIIKSNPG